MFVDGANVPSTNENSFLFVEDFRLGSFISHNFRIVEHGKVFCQSVNQIVFQVLIGLVEQDSFALLNAEIQRINFENRLMIFGLMENHVVKMNIVLDQVMQ